MGEYLPSLFQFSTITSPPTVCMCVPLLLLLSFCCKCGEAMAGANGLTTAAGGSAATTLSPPCYPILLTAGTEQGEEAQRGSGSSPNGAQFNLTFIIFVPKMIRLTVAPATGLKQGRGGTEPPSGSEGALRFEGAGFWCQIFRPTYCHCRHCPQMTRGRACPHPHGLLFGGGSGGGVCMIGAASRKS